jgi:hypothetical protein
MRQITTARAAWAILIVHPRLPARFMTNDYSDAVRVFGSRLDARIAVRNVSAAWRDLGCRLMVVPITECIAAQPSFRAATHTARRVA